MASVPCWCGSTSRGPAFYSQQRVGQFGRVFTIYKLRTMYHHCERLTGPDLERARRPARDAGRPGPCARCTSTNCRNW